MAAGRCPACGALSSLAGDGTAVLLHSLPCREACNAIGCRQSQQLRRDGVRLGYCPKHRTERLRSHPIGTVTPGPRGNGWRVKTAHGWEPSDEHGRTLAAIRARAAAVPTLTDTQLIVLRVLEYPAPLDDRTIAERAGIDKGSAAKRRGELVAGGLVEQAVPRAGRAGARWRLTAAGRAALGTSIFTALPSLSADGWFRRDPLEQLARFS